MLSLPALREQYPEYQEWSDKDIVTHIAQQNNLPVESVMDMLYVPRNEDGFMSSAKRSLSSMAGGVGEIAGDITGNRRNALTRFADDVEMHNPSEINSLADIANNPWLAVRSAAGNAVGFLGPQVGLSALGKALAAVRYARAAQAIENPFTQAALAGLPSMQGIGEAQRESGQGENLPLKYLASLGVGAIENLGGVQRMMGLGGQKTGLREMVEEFGKTPLRTAGKTMLRTGLEEGAEELAQNPIEQFAGFQDPTSSKNIDDTLFSGAMGALGGLTFGAVGGGYRSLAHNGIASRLRAGNFLSDSSAPADLLQGLDAEQDFKEAPLADSSMRQRLSERMQGYVPLNVQSFTPTKYDALGMPLDGVQPSATPIQFNPAPVEDPTVGGAIFGNNVPKRVQEARALLAEAADAGITDQDMQLVEKQVGSGKLALARKTLEQIKAARAEPANVTVPTAEQRLAAQAEQGKPLPELGSNLPVIQPEAQPAAPEALESAVAALSKKQREYFDAAQEIAGTGVDDHDAAIAKKLGVSKQAVSQRKNGAVKSVLKHIKDKFDLDETQAREAFRNYLASKRTWQTADYEALGLPPEYQSADGLGAEEVFGNDELGQQMSIVDSAGKTTENNFEDVTGNREGTAGTAMLQEANALTPRGWVDVGEGDVTPSANTLAHAEAERSAPLQVEETEVPRDHAGNILREIDYQEAGEDFDAYWGGGFDKLPHASKVQFTKAWIAADSGVLNSRQFKEIVDGIRKSAQTDDGQGSPGRGAIEADRGTEAPRERPAETSASESAAETADEVTAEGIVDRWNKDAKTIGVVGWEGLSDEQKNYILGSGTWEEFDEAAKEVLDEINGEAPQFSRRGTVAGQSSQHSGEHDETTREIEKAVRADLRKKGQSTATETGFIHAEAVPDSISRLVKAVEKLFGVRVSFVSVSDPAADIFNGLYLGGKTLVINRNADNPYATVIGHEFLHFLRNSNKALYGQLRDALRAVAKAKAFNEATKKHMPSVDAEEEVFSDTFGDHWSDPKFWQELANRTNASVFMRVKTAFVNFLNKLVNQLKALGSTDKTDGIYSDLNAVREAILKTTYEAAKQRKNAMPAMSYLHARFSQMAEGAAPLWYSRAAQHVLAKGPGKAPAAVWMSNLNSWVKSGAIKAEELQWSGVENWLKGQQGTVSREALAQFFNEGGVQIEEKVLGNDAKAQKLESKLAQLHQQLETLQNDFQNSGYFMREVRQGKVDFDTLDPKYREMYYARERIADEIGRLEIEQRNHKNELATHYSYYTEPGAKEGSYREILLKLPKGDGTRLRKGLEYAQMDDGTWNLWDTKGYTDEGDGEWVFLNGFPSKTILEMRAAEDPMLTIHGEPAKHQAPHYGDQNENILATARINERTDAEGNRVLYVEEIQSDWAQDKRKNDGVADAPFIGKTEQWAGLILKRLMRYAADNGFDKVAWSTGEQQFKRWGSERVSWKRGDMSAGQKSMLEDEARIMRDAIANTQKTVASYEEAIANLKHLGGNVGSTITDMVDAENSRLREYRDRLQKAEASLKGGAWIVAATEQTGGNVDGQNIEEMARARGELIEQSGRIVETKEDLRDILRNTMRRENNEQQIDAMTDKLWGRMQKEPEGDFMPRREGMRGFYGDEQGRAPDGKPSWLANALKALPAEIRPKLESVKLPGGTPSSGQVTRGDIIVRDIPENILSDMESEGYDRSNISEVTSAIAMDGVEATSMQLGLSEQLLERIAGYVHVGKRPAATNPGFAVDKTLANRPMPMFSRKVGASEATSPAQTFFDSLSDVLTNAKGFAKEAGFGWLTLEQLADVVKSKTVSAYSGVMTAMQKTSKDLVYRASLIDQGWSTLSPAIQSRLSEVMRQATREQTDPEKGEGSQELRSKYAGLPEQAKSVYKNVRDYYADTTNMRRAIMLDYANKAKLAGKNVEEVNDLFKKLKGPYFPLMRLGRWYSVGMSNEVSDLIEKQKDGTITDAEQKRLDALRKDSKHYMARGHMSRADAVRSAEELGKQYGNSLFNVAEERAAAEWRNMPDLPDVEAYLSKDIPKDVRDHIKSMMTQMVFDMLPEHHALKRQMKREGIYGEEEDMRRVFAQSVLSQSHYISRLKHANDLSEAFVKVKKEGERGNETMRMVGNELAKRNTLAMQSEENPIVDRILQTSYFAHLGMSPAFVLTNMTQVPMITAPWLGARHGFGATFRAIAAAYSDTARMMQSTYGKNGLLAELDWRKHLNADESKLFQELLDRNLLDITIEHDLGAVANMRSSKLDKYIKLANAPVRITELANRATTGLAAYRLGIAKGMTVEQATEHAAKAISETQLNYSGLNAPRLMRSVLGSKALARLMFQFRKYQQGMVYLVTKNMYDSVKGSDAETRSAARRTLAGLFGTTGLMAGAIGMPFFGLVDFVTTAIMSVFGDGDDPFDFETEFRNWLTDIFGKDAALVLAKGLPTAFGADLSKRVGMGDIGSPLPFKRQGKTGTETVTNYLAASAGAAFGTMADVLDGIQLLGQGQTAKGAEKIVPIKAAANLIRAARYSDEGMTNRNGEIILPDEKFSPWDLALRAAGFQPVKEAEYFSANKAVEDAKKAASDTRSKLLRDYAQGKLRGDDVSEVEDDIRDFNSRHNEKGVRIDTSSKLKAVQARRKMAAERDESGVKGDKATKPYLDRGRFATG